MGTGSARICRLSCNIYRRESHDFVAFPLSPSELVRCASASLCPPCVLTARCSADTQACILELARHRETVEEDNLDLRTLKLEVAGAMQDREEVRAPVAI